MQCEATTTTTSFYCRQCLCRTPKSRRVEGKKDTRHARIEYYPLRCRTSAAASTLLSSLGKTLNHWRDHHFILRSESTTLPYSSITTSLHLKPRHSQSIKRSPFWGSFPPRMRRWSRLIYIRNDVDSRLPWSILSNNLRKSCYRRPQSPRDWTSSKTEEHTLPQTRNANHLTRDKADVECHWRCSYPIDSGGMQFKWNENHIHINIYQSSSWDSWIHSGSYFRSSSFDGEHFVIFSWLEFSVATLKTEATLWRCTNQ